MIEILIITLIGFVCAVALAVIAKKFEVKEDPRVERAAEALPGANCGGCGFAGCAAYAKAVVFDGAAVNLCAPGGESVLAALSEISGRCDAVAESQIAVILCGGTNAVAPKRSEYNGISDCYAANIVAGGDKACAYGCLGYGNCARVCPQNAIEIVDGLARVVVEKCVGCGLCAKTCPRGLVKMASASHKTHIFCSSPEKGAIVRKLCKNGCIGCGICAKLDTTGTIEMHGALARINYDKAPISEEHTATIAAKCPAKCMKRV